MKVTPFNRLKTTMLFALSLAMSISLTAQVGGWNPKLEEDAAEALETIMEENPKLQSFYDKAYGYAVFPKVTKVAITFGGAIGKGVVYKNHKAVGTSKLKQASFGLQLGGQQYMEVIFFETEADFDRFTNGKLKFDAQASAVALDDGASIDLAFQEGVAVFTSSTGGLMVEASIGGQHFKYKPKAE